MRKKGTALDVINAAQTENDDSVNKMTSRAANRCLILDPNETEKDSVTIAQSITEECSKDSSEDLLKSYAKLKRKMKKNKKD